MGEMQRTFRKCKKQQAGDSRNGLTDTCGKGSSADAHLANNDKNIVQNGIQDTCDHRQNKAKVWSACSNKIRLKQTLQDGCRCKADDDRKVTVAVSQQKIAGSQDSGNRSQIHMCQHKNDNTDEQTDDHKLGHTFLGFFIFAFPHVTADNGIATGAQHGANGKNNINDWINNV